jgi:hypothetical protein
MDHITVSNIPMAVLQPYQSTKDLPKGLLRKIIREDLDLDLDEFLNIYK